MDDSSSWKQALSARRKQFEILSAYEAPLKCTVFRASGDGRNLLADPRFDDLKNHLHEGSVGQSCLKDSDTIIHALFFGDKKIWERFSSAADESGRIASKIPSEVLAGLSGYFYNSTLLCPIAEWSSLIAEISVNIAWSKCRRKVLHPKLPMSVDWKPSMPDFWFIELENVFTASCDSIDVLTDAEVPGPSERAGKLKSKFYKPEGTPVPEAYQQNGRPCGPLTDNESNLAFAVTAVKNNKRLRTAAKSKKVFVHQITNRMFDVHFRSFQDLHEAKERLESLTQNVN